MPWVIGEAGRLCEPLDPRDLAMQVLGVLQNEELRADLIRRGLERAHEFSLERYEAGLSSILSELAAPGPTATDRVPLPPRPSRARPCDASGPASPWPRRLRSGSAVGRRDQRLFDPLRPASRGTSGSMGPAQPYLAPT